MRVSAISVFQRITYIFRLRCLLSGQSLLGDIPTCMDTPFHGRVLPQTIVALPDSRRDLVRNSRKWDDSVSLAWEATSSQCLPSPPAAVSVDNSGLWWGAVTLGSSLVSQARLRRWERWHVLRSLNFSACFSKKFLSTHNICKPITTLNAFRFSGFAGHLISSSGRISSRRTCFYLFAYEFIII